MGIESIRRAPLNAKDFAYEGLKLAEENSMADLEALQTHDEAVLFLEIATLQAARKKHRWFYRMTAAYAFAAFFFLFSAPGEMFGRALKYPWLAIPAALLLAYSLYGHLKRMQNEEDLRMLQIHKGRLGDLYILALRLRGKFDEMSVVGSEVRREGEPPPHLQRTEPQTKK